MIIKRFLLCASLLALPVVPAAAVAAPTPVDVRIEGKTSTIFFGPVTTDAKVLTTTAGGTHACDGTNAGANPAPGPTPTTALNDAAVKGGFTWDGPWFGTDFFASRIAGESESLADFAFWGVLVDGVLTDVGGCQIILRAGQEVLWAYDRFNKDGGLKLTAPASVNTGATFEARVTNLGTGVPLAGALVGTTPTNGDGVAALSFDRPGVYALKAEHPRYVRSREVRVCVDPPQVEACTSTDRTAPSVRIDVPRISSSTSRFGSIRAVWQGDDSATGSGIRRYRVEQRRLDAPSEWKSVAKDTAQTVTRIPARAGSAYELRVQAFDRAGNASALATGITLVPLDDLSARIKLSESDWKLLRRPGAYQRTVSRSTEEGATASLSFTGTQATLVTRTLPKGGRVQVTVDDVSKVVNLRGKGRFRSKLIATKAQERGEHTLRIKSLGGGPVEIDAIAIAP